MELVIIGAVVWAALGVSGFIYWWTTEFDLRLGDLFITAFSGFVLGPFTWITGYFTHRPRRPRTLATPRVLVKKRP